MKKKRILYVLVAIVSAIAVFFVEVWAINLRFLQATILSNNYSLTEKINLLATTGDSFKQSFPLSSQISIVALAILVGVYAALLLFYLRNHYKIQKAAGLGVLGSVFGTLGVGCGVCGSIVLSSFFGAGTSAAFLALLPFKGVEFSGVGIVILFIAIYVLVLQIRKPIVCKT